MLTGSILAGMIVRRSLEDAMGSATKFTKTRRRMKAARKAELRSKKANKMLVKLQAKGFNKPIAL